MYEFMVPVYGKLVMFGKYTIDPADKTKKQVPDEYIEEVAIWLTEHVEEEHN